MMKRAIALCAIFLAAIGCTTLVYEARYDIDLSGVVRHEPTGEIRHIVDVHGHTFEDEFIRVTWTPHETQLGLILVNKTDSPQSILWEEVRFVGPDGKSDRVVHEDAQAGVVAPGNTLLDLIEPAAHVSPVGVAGRRQDAPLIGFTHGTSAGEVRSRMVHGTINVLLPIAANGATRVYVFQFSIKGTVVQTGWSS